MSDPATALAQRLADIVAADADVLQDVILAPEHLPVLAAQLVAGDGGANGGDEAVDREDVADPEVGGVDLFSFVDVDRAAYVSVEARVEETRRILQGRAFGEGKLHGILVGFASADDAVVRPNRIHPLPLLDDVRVCCLDELAHSAEGFPAPVPEFDDSFRDELRCRLALARA